LRLFDTNKVKGRPGLSPPTEHSMGDLRFVSASALERGLDGSEERFARYFHALYRCDPDDKTPDAICQIRNELRAKHPDKAIVVGNRFVLTGRPAFDAVGGYYHGLMLCDTQSDEMRAYWKERFEETIERNRASQSLPVPIDLTEGQLAHDSRMEFLTCIALLQGQVLHKADLG
jgi:hypothetical protein